jgi:DNA-binding transcriptional regulator YiaG
VTRLVAYLSTALTGLAPDARAGIDATVAVVREVCAAPAVDLDVYFPGDHTDPLRDAHVAPDEVFRIDRDRVKSSDVLLAFGHVPSVGVGQELNMALAAALPVVFLVPDGVRVSRMALGAPYRSVQVPYATDDELRERLHDTLAALRPELEARRARTAPLDANVTGARIRAAREASGLSRDELADAAGLTSAALALLEDSPDRLSDPSLTQLRLLAAALGVETATLL